MRNNYTTFIIALAFIVSICSPTSAYALQESKPLSTDQRVKTFVYIEDEVFIFIGHYRYQSTIVLDKTETIQSISVGDSLGWLIEDTGNRIFLKPVEPDAQTNMTVITDKRTYLFELHAEEAEDIRDEELSFITKFRYPGVGANSGAAGGSISNEDFIEFPNDSADKPKIYDRPEEFNFNYSITGSTYIAPRKIFDDGIFTYIEFKSQNSVIPAIFKVAPNGDESLINYHMKHGYIIIEEVVGNITLRYGDEIACIFNELYIQQYSAQTEKPKKRKKFLGIF